MKTNFVYKPTELENWVFIGGDHSLNGALAVEPLTQKVRPDETGAPNSGSGLTAEWDGIASVLRRVTVLNKLLKQVSCIVTMKSKQTSRRGDKFVRSTGNCSSTNWSSFTRQGSSGIFRKLNQ